jgi:hypothetical protein
VLLSGDPLGTGLGWAKPDRVADANLPGSERGINRWFRTEAFVQPAAFTPGNAGRGTVVTPGSFNLDLAMYKNFGIRERDRIQFRAEAFNALNHTNLGTPRTTFGLGTFGKIFGAGSSRIMQFALKYIF